MYSNVSFVVITLPEPEPEHDGARSAMEVMTMFEMSDAADAARHLIVLTVSVLSPGRGSGRGRRVP